MYQQPYPNLFKPAFIRGQVIRNRIVSAPMGDACNLMEFDVNGYQHFTKDAAHYYGSIAKGGAGIVCTGECGVDPRYYTSTSKFNFFSDDTLTGMHFVTDAIHAFGGKAAIELSHPGMFAPPDGCDAPPMGPSPIVLENTAHVETMNRTDGQKEVSTVREMTAEDMNDVADYFAKAAVMSKRGGFDVIYIHCGHGWLLNQFISPHVNKRSDEFGGCIENRVKFPIMVLDRIRQAVGNEMILSIRFSANEFVEDGNTEAEIITAAKLLSEHIDVIQCSCGIRSGMHSLSITHPTNFLKEACNSYLSEMIKQQVSIPVEAVGSIGDPETANSLIEKGVCDFVAMVRAQIADPDWAKKAKAGRAEDIRPCIRCLRCIGKRPTGQSLCSVNPAVAWACMEYSMVEPAERKKKVLVIGGGPSGMQAALKLSDRGHDVILCEKSGSLGGQLKHAAFVDFKVHLDKFMRYLITQVNKDPRIEIRLNTEMNAEKAEALGADAVIVAVGAVQSCPPIKGKDLPIVRYAVDAFMHQEEVGKNVVIIGGGVIGCEAAAYFVNHGRKVSVVEVAPRVMDVNAEPHLRYHTLVFMDNKYDRETAQLDRFTPLEEKTAVYTSSRCLEITEHSVIIENAEGVKTELPADTVIMSAGMKPDTALRNSFFGIAEDVIPVGDCVKTANVCGATRSAYFAALQI